MQVLVSEFFLNIKHSEVFKTDTQNEMNIHQHV